MLKESVFNKLWDLMTARGDVPSLQYSAEHIIRSLQNEQASAAELTSLVLSDLALSQKVFRLANSPMYRTLGGEVSTVSRAIMVLGVDTVEHLSLGLQLLSQFQSSVGAREDARSALKRALMAAEFTRKMTSVRGSQLSEEAVVCALMHQLARLLVILYFENEWSQIQALLAADPTLTESTACQQVLGVTLAEIAIQAAERWSLPPTIRRSMYASLPSPDAALMSHEDWLGAVASVSSGVATMMDANASEEEVAAFVCQYTEVLALNEASVLDALALVRESAEAIDLTDEPANASPDEPIYEKPSDAGRRLEVALEEIRAEASSLAATSVTPWVVESIMKALNLKTGFMMLLHPSSNRYMARFGFGPGIRERLPRLSFDAAFVPDIFHMVATRFTPTLFGDIKEEGVSHRVPQWYKAEFPDARSVVLVPVRLRGRCIAMLCGSWGDLPCATVLNGREVQALSALAEEVSRSFERAAASQSR